MAFTTTHFIGFVIGDIDWSAEVEIATDRHDTNARINYIAADLGGGRAGVTIEGEAMKLHGGLVDGEWKTFLEIATAAMNKKLPDLMERHDADEAESAADDRADAKRDARAA